MVAKWLISPGIGERMLPRMYESSRIWTDGLDEGKKGREHKALAKGAI